MTKWHGAMLAAAVFLAWTAVPAEADPLRHRQYHQSARIARGIDDGSLTRGEARALHREQRAIRHGRRHALADGRIGPYEARRLGVSQYRASRHIYRFKHNEIDAE